MSEPKPFLVTLKSWDPCEDGYEWALENNFESLEALWSKCHRADWMLWVDHKSGIKLDESKLRLFACDCAERALPAFEAVFPDDKRPREAIEISRRYAVGQATEEERDAARSAAELAARSAARSAESARTAESEWSAAEWAARLAARSAAEWAARSAELAARSAAELAARSAVESESAAGQYQADRLRIYFPSVGESHE